jgi:L-seryl-tRNA(Ser) seleniumtransferase
MKKEEMRKIPGVDTLLASPAVKAAADSVSPVVAAETIRGLLDGIRKDVSAGGECPDFEDIEAEAGAALRARMSLFMRSAINATGVIIHTNMGRAPLSLEVIEKLSEMGSGYCNLELNLLSGKRGFRGDIQEELLVALTGAEDAAVVNNNAGALFLILAQHAKGGEVVVSRGELIQIGGGFRIPDILEQSGAKLREVGATNHTNLEDYKQAITPATRMILKAHHSNFKMEGFVKAPEDKALAALAREKGILFVYDTGSGAMMNVEELGIQHEPTAMEAMKAGADLACFSGDKLLGGPQAGIIVGKREYVSPLKKHPLFRALRPDKLCLAALQHTLVIYLKGEAAEKIPVLKMMSMRPEEILRRAENVVAKTGLTPDRIRIIEGRSTIGGGSTPGETLPTFLISISPKASPDRFAARLRAGSSPVVARIFDNSVCFDLRTVLPSQDDTIAEIIKTEIDAV